MMKNYVLTFILFLCNIWCSNSQTYRHYTHHHYPTSSPIETYDNRSDDFCHLSVRCPALSSLSQYDRDSRNRRFTVDTFLAMHGPPGPSGIQGPSGEPGQRGPVGLQGEPGLSKEYPPLVAFIAYLQKMLSIETNKSEVIIFEKFGFNEGNGYNTTTGTFTAPYTGIYKFSITIMAQMDSIATVRIVHNNLKILGMIRCDCRRRFSHVRGSVYVNLEENDTILIEALGDLSDPVHSSPRNNIYGYTYTHFSGSLLYLTKPTVNYFL